MFYSKASFNTGYRYRSKPALPNVLQHIHFTEQVNVAVIFYIFIQRNKIRIWAYAYGDFCCFLLYALAYYGIALWYESLSVPSKSLPAHHLFLSHFIGCCISSGAEKLRIYVQPLDDTIL
jgi:hypothetical protein